MQHSVKLGGALLAWIAATSCAGTVDTQTAAGTSSGTAGATTTASTTTTTTTTTGGGSVTGTTGGMLDTLNFAIVGDTRPPNEDDTAGYPTAVITQIWKDVQAFSPRPAFAVTTGDYQFSQPYGTQSAAQIGLYLTARAAFSNVVFPAMGNHECTGATASNCGQGNVNGTTNNFNTFLGKMLAPLKVTLPYYTVDVASTTPGAWTAKFVFVAANAWDNGQATWLDAELAKPTTYTFVVRHESLTVTETPGVSPSQAIIDKHPYTLLIVGHTHTYQYEQNNREVIVGNGGAPLSGNVDYGYVVAQQRSDGAMVFKAYDYKSNMSFEQFAVKADGTATQ